MVGDDYSTVKFNSSIPLDSLFAEKDTNDVPCEKKKTPTVWRQQRNQGRGLTLSRSYSICRLWSIEFFIFVE